MKTAKPKVWKDPLTAVLFAVYFLLLVAVYYIWEQEYLGIEWMLPIALGVVAVIYLSLGYKLSVSFGGFCMLMIAHNMVWQIDTLPLPLKILATIVTVWQFSTLGDKNRGEEGGKSFSGAV